MKHIHFLNLSVWMTLVSACKGNLDPAPAPVIPEDDKGKETFEHLTALSVVLKGKLDVTDASLVKEYGFWYKKGAEGEPVKIVAENLDDQFNFSSALIGLEPSTQYFYQTFYRLEGDPSYGEMMSFTTKELSATLETRSVSELAMCSVCLNAYLDEELLYAAAIDYGFKWGKTDASLDNDIDCKNLLNKAYSAPLTGLFPSTQYSFKAYVKVDDKVYEGETETFTTQEATNLSSSASANCYIVSSAGGYKFKTLQGNSSTSVSGVAKAELLWESFGTSMAPSKGDLISALSYSDDFITFTTPSTLKNGNAVIVAKDASDNILWSWHIWVCDKYDPAAAAQIYNNSADVVMDRNLGAISATAGNFGALGLLYQWGRKDPFLGGCLISYDGDDNQQKAASTLSSWPSPVSSDSSNGTIDYAVAHPTTFIKANSNNRDWYYTGTSTTDNGRWGLNKTKYDPCPPGWRVFEGGPDQGWSKAKGSTDAFDFTWDTFYKGMNFFGLFGIDNPIWYPAAGDLNPDSGSLTKVGKYGKWWSCTPKEGNQRQAYIFIIKDDRGVYPVESDARASGLSVRCVQE